MHEDRYGLVASRICYPWGRGETQSADRRQIPQWINFKVRKPVELGVNIHILFGVFVKNGMFLKYIVNFLLLLPLYNCIRVLILIKYIFWHFEWLVQIFPNL